MSATVIRLTDLRAARERLLDLEAIRLVQRLTAKAGTHQPQEWTPAIEEARRLLAKEIRP